MTESLPNDCVGILQKGITTLKLDVCDDKQNQLLRYITLLVKWNNAYNLTAIRQPEQMITRHLLDSLSVSAHLEGKHIIDVGTGAGLPGLVLAIVFPEKQFTLMDSNGKKVRFLQHVKQSLSLKNIFPIQQRVEEHNVKQRYDNVISRAITSLEQMVKLSEKLVSDNGIMQAMKGLYPEPNHKQLPQGWVVDKVIQLTVPELDEQRHLINIKKSKS